VSETGTTTEPFGQEGRPYYFQQTTPGNWGKKINVKPDFRLKGLLEKTGEDAGDWLQQGA